jgi:prepilin-type processing-associated H-X9-DG protein
VVQHGRTVYYVFADGHKLPMLCSCCDGSLVYQDLEKSRQELLGMQLATISINPRTLDDGREIEELILEFFDGNEDSEKFHVPVSFAVAARMRHPATCPFSKRSASGKASSKQKRRYRKIPGRN